MSDRTATILECVQISMPPGAPAAVPTVDSRLEDLGYDSLAKIELMLSIEEAFGVVVDDAEAEKVETVQQIIDIVNERAPQ